jgi:hypothetical protein
MTHLEVDYSFMKTAAPKTKHKNQKTKRNKADISLFSLTNHLFLFQNGRLGERYEGCGYDRASAACFSGPGADGLNQDQR